MATRNARAARSNAPADIASAAEALGIEVHRGDENEIHASCPKHLERTGKQDRHPSFSINRNSGLFACWSCQYSGNFQRLVMDLKFPNDAFKASRWMRQFGVDLAAHVDGLRLWEERPAPSEAVELDLRGRYEMFIDPPAKVLAKRRISPEAARHYGIRWDTGKRAWITPIRGQEAKLLGWQVKVADGRYFRNYPIGVRKGDTLFGLDVFPYGETAILVESPLDVARLYTAGVSGGLASFGAKFTQKQLKLIVANAAELLAAFDNDEAGRLAHNLLLRGDAKKKIPRAAIKTWIINYNGISAKDVGDMDDAELHWSLENAVFGLKMIVDQQLGRKR